MNKLKRLVRAIRDYYVIKNSGLFDAHYYLTNNSDVRHADINPLKHYVKHGGLEGRNPSAKFDGEYYLNANADVKEANLNPLAHYLRYGEKEGRKKLLTLNSCQEFVGDNDKDSSDVQDAYEIYVANNSFNSKKKLIIESDITINTTFDFEQRLMLFSNIIGNKTVVSFDIFDTLIQRSFLHPTTIFSRVEQRFKMEYKKEVHFKQFRMESELLARKETGKQEITFEDIYHTLSENFSLEANIIDILKRLEIEEEIKAASAKKSGLELLRLAKEQKKKIVFISDMYLSKAAIMQLLEKTNINLADVDIYISSEIQKTKHHGTLFQHLLAIYNESPNRWLHVGDNLHSDINMAKEFGIDAYYLPSSLTLFNKKNRHLIDEFSCNEQELVYSSVFGQIALKNYSDSDISTLKKSRYSGDTYRIGYEALGPVFLGFLHNLYKAVIKNKYDKIYFISRDGFYLKQIYDQLQANIPSLPKSEYFLSSRLLSYSATLVDVDAILTVANKDYFPTTLRHLLTYRFSFDLDMFNLCDAKLKQFGFTSYDDEVIQHKNHKNFTDFVAEISSLIIKANHNKYEDFKAYIEKSGMTNKSVIVDIGYAGSLQPTLKEVANITVEGIYFIVNKKINELDKADLRYHAYIDSSHPLNSDFFNNIQLFELFFSATHPSVIGIDKDLQPIYDRVSFDKNSNLFLAKLHQGAVEFVHDYLNQYQSLFMALNEYSVGLMLKNILYFFKEPDELDCYCFSSIVFEDNFGANKYPLITSNRNILAWDDLKIQQHGYWASASRKLAKLNIHLSDNEAHSKDFADCIVDNKLVPAFRLIESNAKKQSDKIKHFHLIIKLRKETVKSTIDNLTDQVYPYWTATLILDEPLESKFIKEIPLHAFQRIQVECSKEAEAVIDRSSHEHFVLIEAEVKIEPDLLYHIASHLNIDDYSLIYTDHDYLLNGKRQRPEFKPDFSPELLLSQPYYLGPLVYAKKDLIQQSSLAFSSLIDILPFEAILQKRKVGHIPNILYHAKPVNFIEKKHSKLISDYLTLIGIKFKRVFTQLIDNEKQVYSIEFPDEGPGVAIIIPTKNKFEVLKVALDSIEQTKYKNYKVYIIDNESTDDDIKDYFKKTKHTILHIASPNGQFSYSYINNEAAKRVAEDYVLFLNNDVKVITPEWLSQMMGLVQIEGIGSVGARLYYGNGKLQHVGIVNRVSAYGLPAPALKLIEGDANGYLNYARSIKNFSAMTAACMLTPKKLFLDMGGFDDVDFSVAYNDCDYGFRLTQAGYRNVLAPNAELYHYEGVTRGIGVGNDKPSEEAAFIRKYKSWRDPFYNINLTDEAFDFSISTRTSTNLNHQKFRCLFVTHNLNYEGAPLIMYEVAKGLKQQGFIDPVVLSPFEGELRDAYESEGIKVQVLDTNIMSLFSAKDERSYQDALNNVKQYIGRLNVNVVVANTILCHWAIESAFALDIPSNWIIHESEPPFEHLREHSKLVESHGKKAINYPYRVVFVANTTRALFSSYNRRNNFTTIYNGFDYSRMKINMTEEARNAARKELGINDKFVFICPGVVSKRKAQIDALKAYELLPNDIKKKVVILIVGDRESPYSKQLHKVHQAMPELVRDNIKIIKETKDIAKYYNASDAFLFTSHLESFPKVIQEAMYLGLPIVSTNTFGISEQVHHMNSALLCNSSEIQALSKNIQKIITDKTLRNKLKVNAFFALQKLPSYEEMIADYNSVLQESYMNVIG